MIKIYEAMGGAPSWSNCFRYYSYQNEDYDKALELTLPQKMLLNIRFQQVLTVG
ncbi:MULTISPECIES: hypothetical protein [Sulfolobaceae]|uniref:hypothetical protein n=1 Tax=Sulfolobaceae TaxID=118883 RepID=UPI0012EA227D|nr:MULTISPECIES: hypothetical protein [unclassified Sulfolobus]